MAQYPPPPQQQQPVYYPVYYPAPQPQKRSGCLTCFLIALVVGVVGCVVLAGAGVGGYFLIKNNTISLNERQILSLVGKAPGEANIVNLADENVTVTLTALDNSDSSSLLLNNELQLEPLDVDGFAMNAGRYQLDFTYASGTAETCTLRIASGDDYQFIATAQGTIVASTKSKNQGAVDVRVSSSSICQQ